MEFHEVLSMVFMWDTFYVYEFQCSSSRWPWCQLIANSEHFY